jgi:hypothetical protein
LSLQGNIFFDDIIEGIENAKKEIAVHVFLLILIDSTVKRCCLLRLKFGKNIYIFERA